MRFRHLLQFLRAIWSSQAVIRTLRKIARWNLTRNLLELARIDAIPLKEDSAMIDLSQLVAEVAEYVETICREQDIVILQDLEKNVMAFGNKKQLQELVTNLLSNAVRYTAPCLIRTIELSVRHTEHAAQLVVADTGIGIAPDKLPHIFKRFYRAPECRNNIEGYGLGLAIVKRVVDRHRGSIQIESVVGKGTRIIVEFPQEVVEPA
jgi:signal transduction histidine kinase